MLDRRIKTVMMMAMTVMVMMMVMAMVMVMAMAMVMLGGAGKKNYIYKLPIDRSRGCYW